MTDNNVSLQDTIPQLTKAEILALPSPTLGDVALATDTNLLGYYTGDEWVWSTTEGPSFADVLEEANYLKVDTSNDPITGQLASNVATGTAPFAVESTTVNTNLNADMLDGFHGGQFMVNPMISPGDLVYLPDGNITITANQSTSTWIETARGTLGMQLVPDMVVDIDNFVGSLSINASLMIEPGDGSDYGDCVYIAYIQRDNLSGTILTEAWLNFRDPVHNNNVLLSFIDNNPTTGKYVVSNRIARSDGGWDWIPTWTFSISNLRSISVTGMVASSIMPSRLPIGSSGQVLTVNTGLPTWSTPVSAVTSISATAPIASTGGATPTISISAATQSADGSMTSSDKTKLDGITGTNTGDITLAASAAVLLDLTGQALSLDTQTANTALMGPTSGSPAVPTFRPLASSDFMPQAGAITLDPTGFTDSESVVVSYDPTTQKVTLTGTVVAYWRGSLVPVLTTGWVSAAHDNITGYIYRLSYNGSAFVWTSDTNWSFDQLQIAVVNYGTTYKYAIRECHGLMPWTAHEVFHETIGTFRETGGTLGSWLANSTTVGNRRPTVTATTVHDEDCTTVNAALTTDLYTQVYLTGSAVTNYLVDSAEIVPVLANNPYYNLFSTPNWTQVLMANNSYMSVWLAAVPVTSDAISQNYRYLWIQGQSNGNLASQTALTPSDLNLGTLRSEASEFVFIAKVIIRYTGGNWDITSVTNLTGNKFIQIASPAGAFLSTVATNTSLTGDGTLANPLAVSSSTALPAGALTGDLIRYNATTGLWEKQSEPAQLKGIVLTPALSSLIDAEGAMYYNSTVKAVMVCTDI